MYLIVEGNHTHTIVLMLNGNSWREGFFPFLLYQAFADSNLTSVAF